MQIFNNSNSWVVSSAENMVACSKMSKDLEQALSDANGDTSSVEAYGTCLKTQIDLLIKI